jgi:hypothetical protein
LLFQCIFLILPNHNHFRLFSCFIVSMLFTNLLFYLSFCIRVFLFPSQIPLTDNISKLSRKVKVKKGKQSHYTPWRRLWGEEV